MPLVSPKPEQHFVFCGETCLLLYQEMGFQSALTYLFAYLRKYYSLSRIFSGFRHYARTEFVPMGDTLSGTVNSIVTLATSNLTQEQIRTLMGTDAFEPYFVRQPKLEDDSQLVALQEDYTCYLRVPLFTQGESTFQMAFCSREVDAFTKADGELFFLITRPLAAAMNDDFSGVQPFRNIHTEVKERSDLMLMCHGLTELCTEIKKIASTDCTVLVNGPTGSGKEVMVNTLHAFSRRSSGPLIKVNCGAIAESLLESELFGYEKGAFTGAQQSRAGFFEAANGGTLFLDEIGDLPPRMQVGLLRVLDNREIIRVGSTRSIPLNVRILVATHRNLRQMVIDGTFREDLWYRLNAYALRIPPLSEHRVDIPVLVHYFVNKVSQEMNLFQPPYIASEQLEALFGYNWPGNIRELRHVVERSVLRARQGNACGPVNFISVIEELKRQPTARAMPVATVSAMPSGTPEENARAAALPQLPSNAPWPTLAQWTDAYIRRVLDKTGGKITGVRGAATLLGVHPNTLRARRERALQGDSI